MQKTIRQHLRGTEGQEVNGGHASLFTRRHVDDDGATRRMLDDGVVRRFRHGDESRGVVRRTEAVNVHLQGNRAHIRVKVEEGGGRATQPLRNVASVAQRRR